jgi:hypothetical protein
MTDLKFVGRIFTAVGEAFHSMGRVFHSTGRRIGIFQQQAPPKIRRAPSGLAGSSLAPPPKPPVPPSTSVLVHFCFDQGGGETKKEWCPCKMQVTRDEAAALINTDRADWLIVKNSRAASGVSNFTRAIVIRSEIIQGERVWALKPPLRTGPRERRHEAIKTAIRLDMRRILQKLFARGVIPANTSKMSDANLDILMSDPRKVTDFLSRLRELGQNQFHDRAFAVIEHWWNNVLGYCRMNVDAGATMKGADHGTGLVVYTGDTAHTEEIAGARNTDTHRVAVANFRASFWNGAWDFSTGQAPEWDGAPMDYERPASEFDVKFEDV